MIYLIDNTIDESAGSREGGHSYKYCMELLKLEGTKWISDHADLCDLKQDPIRFFKEGAAYLRKYSKYDTIHILRFDKFYKQTGAFRFLKRKKTRIIATLHHYPQKTLNKLMLVSTSRYIDTLVVHSDYIRDELNAMGVKCDIRVIYYPVFGKTDPVEEHCRTKRKKFLCLGGTRKDKGLNVLMESFRYMKDETKAEAAFIVAGKEEDIKYRDFEESARINGIKTFTFPGFLSDQMYWDLLNETDIVLLPYTRIFAGASGPLTDGVSCGKFILGHDHGNIGDTIKRNGLGITFLTENAESLAEKIDRAVHSVFRYDEKYTAYKGSISTDDFRASYAKIYSEDR